MRTEQEQATQVGTNPTQAVSGTFAPSSAPGAVSYPIASQQARPEHPGGFTVYRDRRGTPRWYQRWAEAWWIITGRWSLHRAWQRGHDHGSMMEYHRTVIMGGR